MVAADAAADSRTGAAQHTGPPLRPQGCCASPAATACGRPWPRSLCGPWAAGNQGPGHGPAPGQRATPGHGRATGYRDHGKGHLL